MPHMADSFVDSIGINTHLDDSSTPYEQLYSTFAPLLKSSGIRHLRDGLLDTTWQTYYANLNQLGLAGIHATLITSIGQTAALLQSYPARIPNSFEAYEGPNEYDNSGDPNWASKLQAFMPMLYTAVKSNASTSHFPVIGPSLISVSDEATLGNLSSSMDYGNIHDYFAGFNPGTPGWGSGGFGSDYGSILYNIGAEEQVSGTKPIIATETGYCTLPNTVGAVSTTIQGRYVPRLFMEQFNAGIARTFEYEFADDGASYFGSCGLTTSTFTPRPAYYALSSIIHLLSDPGPSFTTVPLVYTLTGQTANVHHLLLQSRNGAYWLALWIETESWNPNTETAITVPTQAVTVSLPITPLFATLSTLDDTGTMTTAHLTPSAMVNLNLTDRVSILSLDM
jgi:hypothetical protein